MSTEPYLIDTVRKITSKHPYRIIYEGTVETVGDDANYPFRVKVRTSLDTGVSVADIPYCDPFMPIYYNMIPNKGDVVRVLLAYGPSDVQKRLWIGPLVSHPIKYKGEGDVSYFNMELPNTKKSKKVPVVKGKKINKAEGIYANYFKNEGFKIPFIYKKVDYDESSINGKNNTDLLFRSQRVTLRAGKFKIGKSLEINDINPAYIDLFLDSDGSKSHVNIVADKINLVALQGKINTTAVINTEKQQQIIEGEKGLQPLVYGNELVGFLKELMIYISSHKHDYHGQPCRKNGKSNDGDVNGLLKWANKLDTLLSKNVKTN